VAENHQFLLDHTRDSQIEFDCHGWGYIVGGSDGNKNCRALLCRQRTA